MTARVMQRNIGSNSPESAVPSAFLFVERWRNNMAQEHLSNILNALLTGGVLIVPAIAEAASFPPELTGKSVTIRTTTNIRGNFEGTRNGQAITKESMTGGGPPSFTVSFQGDPGPEPGAHCEGRAPLVDSHDFAGTWQVSITFDAGYGGCHARVISRREGVIRPMEFMVRDLPGGRTSKCCRLTVRRRSVGSCPGTCSARGRKFKH
jgi:hypothetical protein